MYKDNLFYNKWNTVINKKFYLITQSLRGLEVTINSKKYFDYRNFNFDQILKKYNAQEYIVVFFLRKK